MKRLLRINLMVSFFLLVLLKTESQSRTQIDTSVFFNWPYIDPSSVAISNNGKYVRFFISNYLNGRSSHVVKSLVNEDGMILPSADKIEFSGHSKYIIYQQKDTVWKIDLSNKKRELISGVQSYKSFMQASDQWIAITTKKETREVRFINLETGLEKSYEGVKDFIISENGNDIVIHKIDNKENDGLETVVLSNLSNNSYKEIWHGRNVMNIVFNENGIQFAFLARDIRSDKKAVFSYDILNERLQKLASDFSPGIAENYEIDKLTNFNEEGNRLFFQLKRIEATSLSKLIRVNVWSYSDPNLNSLKVFGDDYPRSFLAVVNLQKPNEVIQLQGEYDVIDAARTNEWLLAINRKGDRTESYWNKTGIENTYLISISNGKRINIPLSRAKLSPTGKFVIGENRFDKPGDLFIYEIATGITRNITQHLPIPIREDVFDELIFFKSRGLNLEGWAARDSVVLIRDYYDIWKIDPEMKSAPIKLTDGRKQKWQFRLAGQNQNRIIDFNSPVLINLFNTATKRSGFARSKLTKLRTMEDLHVEDAWFTNKESVSPIKARDADLYLVFKERCDLSPNIFVTEDFKRYKNISNLNPEESFNWITSELFRFNTSKGKSTQAILYKPQNFDSTRKYPVIVGYYDKRSDELNRYPHPMHYHMGGGHLNVAWFVTHGYLVALTDIHFRIGDPGESVKDAVESCVSFISQRPFVDKKHIGLQGYSWGGYETNFLASNSKMFSAAVSVSGICDLTSFASNLWYGDYSRFEYVETRGGRLGVTPWERPDSYLNNSPIYFINKVETPILLIHNRNDGNVDFSQGVQFFTSLRRAGKRSWMLEYDNAGHGVGGNDIKDFLLRSLQFFDHYLKDSAAPSWMLNGIHPTMKQIDNGLQLVKEKDPKTGKWLTPKEGGLLIDEEKKKVEKLKHRKPVTVTIE